MKRPTINSAAKVINWLKTALATCGLAGILAATADAGAAPPLRLQLKATPGAAWCYDYTYVAKFTTANDAKPDDRSTQEAKVELSVVTKVESVNKNGRMTLRQKLSRAAQKLTTDGEVDFSFDSAKPGELDKARQEGTYAAVVAALDSSWQVVMEPTGEILDRAVTVPGTDQALKMAVQGFLESVTAQIDLILPDGTSSPGRVWVSGPFDRPLPGLGRLTGETKGIFSALREEEGEPVALIRIERTAMLKADPDSGVSAEITEFEEGGTLSLAPERGWIKNVNLKGTLAYKVKSDRGTTTLRATNQLTVKEGTP